jgi:hypothetical protein
MPKSNGNFDGAQSQIDQLETPSSFNFSGVGLWSMMIWLILFP